MTLAGLHVPSPLTDPEMDALALLHANDGSACVVCRLMGQVRTEAESRRALVMLLQAAVMRCHEIQIRLSIATAPEPKISPVNRVVAWGLWVYSKIGGGT